MKAIDLLIVHQFNPLADPEGGIDSCIQGILKYFNRQARIGIVGVLGEPQLGEPELGVWNNVDLYDRTISFLPVTRLRPGNLERRLPHSARVALGTALRRHTFPAVTEVQTHRADLAAVAKLLWPRTPHRYFIHTQAAGIVSSSSDSLWKWAAPAHKLLERVIVKTANQVRVFNDDYAQVVKSWNASTRPSPTWWDPDWISERPAQTSSRTILWVGRIEPPKNLSLAIKAIKVLADSHPEEAWVLRICGDGTQRASMENLAAQLGIGDRVIFDGWTSREALRSRRAESTVMLMTSVPGYEGYPRVLVEGLASGLPAIVTHGSDTAKLVRTGWNGIVVPEEAEQIAHAIRQARQLNPVDAAASVASLSAPAVIEQLYTDGPPR